MAWFDRPKYTIIKKTEKKDKIPEGMWLKCSKCGEVMLSKTLEDNLAVCPKCGLHNRIDATLRIAALIDEGTFTSMFENITTADYLEFPGYMEKIEKTKQKTGLSEAAVVGKGKIKGMAVALGVTDFSFLGGSLGAVMGERLTAIIELACEKEMPVIIVSGSGGGARMHEGIMSLMQMAKVSAALSRLADKRLPFISVMTDPTGGGVTASFAMLGDINIAEPGAHIMFAGPRVIEQTIRMKLPEGFQRAEYLLEHGMIDMIVKRTEMKEIIYSLLSDLMSVKTAK
ncbi:MAG: acetyl-CoA carboxylase, carboxyltransferase subunit beta [bacterium]